MLIDIIILPPKNFRLKFGKLGLRIKMSFPAFYAVDNKKLIPHLSLFHIKTSKINAVTEKVLAKFSGSKSLMIYPKQIAFHNIGNSYLIGGLGAKKTSALQFFHESAVRALYKFKSGPAFKPQKYYNRRQRYYRTHFGGNPHMLEFYNPHFTLARLKMLSPAQKLELNKLLRTKFIAFKADTIAVAQTNKNHQVIKILKEFKLKA
jgi:hypothetical protein